jgi:predicted ATPase
MNVVIMIDSSTAVADITENNATKREYWGEVSDKFIEETANNYTKLGFEVSIIDTSHMEDM